MRVEHIEASLANALDHAACKPALTEALIARVVALQTGGVTVLTLMECLENLSEEPDQISRAVIEDVLDWLLFELLGGK